MGDEIDRENELEKAWKQELAAGHKSPPWFSSSIWSSSETWDEFVDRKYIVIRPFSQKHSTGEGEDRAAINEGLASVPESGYSEAKPILVSYKDFWKGFPDSGCIPIYPDHGL